MLRSALGARPGLFEVNANLSRIRNESGVLASTANICLTVSMGRPSGPSGVCRHAISQVRIFAHRTPKLKLILVCRLFLPLSKQFHGNE
jgi:hypothetical protein